MGKVHFIDYYSASVSVAYSCHLRPKVNSELSVKEDEPKRILVALCLPGEDCVSVSAILFHLFAAGLVNTFRVFGSLSVEWPGKDGKHPRCPPKGNMPKGNKDMVGAFFPSLVCNCTEGCWGVTAA